MDIEVGSEQAAVVDVAADVLDGRYRLTKALKERPGRIGVYLAVDEATGQEVKIKWRPAGAADRWERREIEVLAALDHPRVPRSLAVIERADGRGFVQTFFAGATPRELQLGLGRLPEAAVQAILASVLEILMHLHEQAVPVIHRDIKPGNLVCLPGGEVAVIDFGIARAGVRDKQAAAVHELTNANTLGYAPPEQVLGLEAGPSADLYALGATAMELLAGVHPIKLWDASRGRLVLPPEAASADMAALLAWLTSPAVAERCPGARAAMDALVAMPD